MVAKKRSKRTLKSRSGYIAFHNGVLVPDHILDNIISAARRGLMTKAGEGLLLIPDTRQGPADVSGLRHIGRYRKADCLTLKQLILKERRKRRLRGKAKYPSKKRNVFKDIKTTESRSGTQLSDGRFLHNEAHADLVPNDPK